MSLKERTRKRHNGTLVNRLAAIDIGTNTVLLLVADIGEDGGIFPLRDMERTTRLGRGLAETGRLHPESLAKTLQVIDTYLTICRGMRVDQILMVGTSALREAENTDDLLRPVHQRCGLTIHIVSGDQEARLSYLAAEEEMGRGSPLLVMDVGGGSVEFIVGRKGEIFDLYSIDIGAVGLTETYLKSDPVTDGEFEQMIDHITGNLRSLAITAPKQVVGLGGTISTISAVHKGNQCFDPSLVHGSLLCRRDVDQQVLLYKRTSLNERLRIPGLPAERADVILAGAAILLEAMNMLGLEDIIVSCHGLRYGLLYAAAHRQCIEKSEK